MFLNDGRDHDLFRPCPLSEQLRGLAHSQSKRNPARQLADHSRPPTQQDRERFHPPRQAQSLKKLGAYNLRILPATGKKILSRAIQSCVALPIFPSTDICRLTQHMVSLIPPFFREIPVLVEYPTLLA